eukprot:scaffold207907_cov48-Prasinocladus_malaysianus.AAC.3
MSCTKLANPADACAEPDIVELGVLLNGGPIDRRDFGYNSVNNNGLRKGCKCTLSSSYALSNHQQFSFSVITGSGIDISSSPPFFGIIASRVIMPAASILRVHAGSACLTHPIIS